MKCGLVVVRDEGVDDKGVALGSSLGDVSVLYLTVVVAIWIYPQVKFAELHI